MQIDSQENCLVLRMYGNKKSDFSYGLHIERTYNLIVLHNSQG